MTPTSVLPWVEIAKRRQARKLGQIATRVHSVGMEAGRVIHAPRYERFTAQCISESAGTALRATRVIGFCLALTIARVMALADPKLWAQ